MFDKRDPEPEKNLLLGHPDGVARGQMIASVHMITTQFPGADANHPNLEGLPEPELTMKWEAAAGAGAAS